MDHQKEVQEDIREDTYCSLPITALDVEIGNNQGATYLHDDYVVADDNGEERIKQGWWVLIFPEGTRIPVGEIGQYKQTGAALARQLGCPLIPVAHNAGAFWPRKSFLKKEGVIRVVVGKPISIHNKTCLLYTSPSPRDS